ncbi:MAG: hypothetical protein WAV38_23775 [Xanthobacteraceae bacterium]|jgi:hypothetical protein
MTASATRHCVRGALLAVSLLTCDIAAALAQSGEPPSSASSAAPATPAGPQQPAPQGAPQLALPPQPPPPNAAAPQAPAEKRGFFGDLSRWWHDSVADFNAKLKEQQSKIDDFNKKSAEAAKDAATATQQAMKNAADAMVKSATSKVIEIHELCAIAGNGAADCASAAANACKGKGFSDGQPLDVRTAEKCNASLWLQGQGQRSASADCPVETVVLRAACQ